MNPAPVSWHGTPAPTPAATKASVVEDRLHAQLRLRATRRMFAAIVHNFRTTTD